MEKTNIKKIILGSLASAVIFGGGYYTNHLITGETDNSSDSSPIYFNISVYPLNERVWVHNNTKGKTRNIKCDGSRYFSVYVLFTAI